MALIPLLTVAEVAHHLWHALNFVSQEGYMQQ